MSEVKQCSICGAEKLLSEFHKWSRWCAECRNKKQKTYRQRNSNQCTRQYEKTPKGFLVRAYRNMLSRVTGVQKREARFYKGLEILPKDAFYEWALAPDSNFWPLYKAWVQASYDQRLTPSVDRLDVYKGYTLDNIRWITHSENSGRIIRRKIA